MTSKTSPRWQLRLNQLIGLVLLFFIFGAVNFIGFKHFYRKNVSLVTYTQIGVQTEKILQGLPGKVLLIDFASPQPESPDQLILRDVQTLLDEYKYKSKGKVELKRINPFIDFEEAKRYADQYKVSDKENVIIIDYNGQKKIVSYLDLADIDASLMRMGMPPTVKAFKAEQVLTSAIQALVEGKKSKVYFLTGHGEYDIMADPQRRDGYSLLADYIQRQNVEVAPLNLVSDGGFPADMDLLVIAGPNAPLAPVEIELLKQYLARTDKPARLMLMLDPKTQSGLEDLLKPYGVVLKMIWLWPRLRFWARCVCLGS
ncbi:MAG: GldG family protein [Blastochloris sp.]|nr:GldG family protein [Blastochloris sp.]